MAKWSDEQREAALALLRDGVGTQETARQTGIPAQTLSRWSKAEGIVSPNAEQTASANESVRLAWAQRRGALTDRLGSIIEGLLDRVEEDGTPAKDVRDYVWSAAVLTDKAQLLSGSATSRHEVLDAQRRRERVERMQDELAGRRAAKDGTTGG
jgi:hypothetical protein